MNPQTPDKITAAEIRELFAALNQRIDDLEATISQVQGGLTVASAPTAQATFTEMQIDTISMATDENGKVLYKAKGAPYQKFGVRIWPETLAAMGIDAAIFKSGPNVVKPITARVLMRTDAEGKTAPQKVIGRA